jgi:hypothetical protein
MTRETSLIPQTADIALYAGDGATLRLTATDTQTGDPIDLTGIITAQIRTSRTDPEAAADFAVDTAGATQGTIELTLTAAQTTLLRTNNGHYRGYWDLQHTPPGQQPRTLIQGTISCHLDVTRPTT